MFLGFGSDLFGNLVCLSGYGFEFVSSSSIWLILDLSVPYAPYSYFLGVCTPKEFLGSILRP
jgi:hypothetical protein